jgi:CBS domain-containing membrane protein
MASESTKLPETPGRNTPVRRTRVRDLMTEPVFTLSPNDTLECAQELMDARRIRHVPVVDEDGDLVGLVTQRDLARTVLGRVDALPISARHSILSSRRVRDMMTREVATADPDTDAYEAAATIFENKFGCLPVVEGSRLVGILTEADFVRPGGHRRLPGQQRGVEVRGAPPLS